MDNLRLHLDVGNIKSYPGSGTVWTDMSQGLIFNSQGTQTPLQTRAGIRCFTFNGSGWWRCSSNFSLVDMGGPVTLIMWLYSDDITVRKTIFEKAGTSYQSYEQEIAVTWEVSDAFSWFSRYNIYDTGSTAAIPLSKWTMVAIKMSTAKTNGVARTGFYSINGEPWISNYTARSTTAVLAAGEIRIGSGYAGTVDKGSISAVSVYNKMLSDDEIKTYFNSVKGRYGLL